MNQDSFEKRSGWEEGKKEMVGRGLGGSICRLYLSHVDHIIDVILVV
jgi:hypothetical protein